MDSGTGVADVAARPDTLEESRVEAKAWPFMNPYVAGVGLGLVLLAAFVIMGRGLGASGALSSLVAWGMNLAAPDHAQANPFYLGYLEGGTHPLKSWLVFEVIGVLAGGFLSGALAGRVKVSVEKGPRIGIRARYFLAFFGGSMMGFGAKLARGCTSGQALTGGALLNLGSWAFMIMIFVGGYALAYFLRRQWT
jgi:uncharacterized membrane protein YedE/YeeE